MWDDSVQTNKLFVGNISWGINWQKLKEIFSEFGEVAYAKIVTDRETQKSRWFGFVEFVNTEDAVSAKEAMNWKEVDGRELNVDFAQDRRED